MTTHRRDGADPSPFSKWVRGHPDLDSRERRLCITDSDQWVHNYLRRRERNVAPNALGIEAVMLVEVKGFGADLPYAQHDTLSLVDGLMRRASSRPNSNRRWTVPVPDIENPGIKRAVKTFGVHVLRMSGDRPDNSDRLLWGTYSMGQCIKFDDITEQQLLELFRFERDPDHPTKMLDTRRHHLRPEREMHPHLPFVSKMTWQDVMS